MRIEDYTTQELFELLNELDETDSLEAKSLHEDSTRSIMESVCAFANEPGCDTLKASAKLRMMRDLGLLEMKGKGKATYYVAGDRFPSETLQGTMPLNSETLIGNGETLIGNSETLIGNSALDQEIKMLGKRARRDYLEDLIVKICRVKPFRADVLSRLLKRNETYLHEILTSLVKAKRLAYAIPEMPTHPRQAYLATGKHEAKIQS